MTSNLKASVGRKTGQKRKIIIRLQGRNQKQKMFPPFYQKCFQSCLTDAQYLTLQLLVLLLQTHRKVWGASRGCGRVNEKKDEIIISPTKNV
jgi:hypothetical protein